MRGFVAHGVRAYTEPPRELKHRCYSDRGKPFSTSISVEPVIVFNPQADNLGEEIGEIPC